MDIKFYKTNIPTVVYKVFIEDYEFAEITNFPQTPTEKLYLINWFFRAKNPKSVHTTLASAKKQIRKELLLLSKIFQV